MEGGCGASQVRLDRFGEACRGQPAGRRPGLEPFAAPAHCTASAKNVNKEPLFAVRTEALNENPELPWPLVSSYERNPVFSAHRTRGACFPHSVVEWDRGGGHIARR